MNTEIPFAISEIKQDIALQPRVTMDMSAVSEWAEAMKQGAKFPPICVFDVAGEGKLLVDGFHRVLAAKNAGLKEISAQIITGTRREAILFSFTVNGTHGIRRTNADKHQTISRMLGDPEWCQWSNREIARRCNVTEGMIRSLRKKRSEPIPTECTFTNRYGAVSTMNTENARKKTPPVSIEPADVNSEIPFSVPISREDVTDLLVQTALNKISTPVTCPAEKPIPLIVVPSVPSHLLENERRAQAFVDTLNDDYRDILNKIQAKEKLDTRAGALRWAIRSAGKELSRL
jgi:hypothetical protein